MGFDPINEPMASNFIKNLTLITKEKAFDQDKL